MRSIVVVLVSVVMSVCAQLMVKGGINAAGDLNFAASPVGAYLRVFTSPLVIGGTVVYLVAILLWVYALSKTPLSFAYPIISVSFALTVLGARLFLGEAVPPVRWVGVGVITAGVCIVGLAR